VAALEQKKAAEAPADAAAPADEAGDDTES
jgi:hypothetical protein